MLFFAKKPLFMPLTLTLLTIINTGGLSNERSMFTYCSSCGSDRNQRTAPQNPRNDNNKNVKKVIAVVSGKGGVGKSLVTSLLAVKARQSGLKTAILDADITGPSIPKSFGLSGKATCNEEGTIIYPPETRTGIKTMSLN